MLAEDLLPLPIPSKLQGKGGGGREKGREGDTNIKHLSYHSWAQPVLATENESGKGGWP